MEEFDRPAIDRLDLRLLDILQRQGALSVAEVAAQLRISTTTCWRRIQQLEQNGVIKGARRASRPQCAGPRRDHLRARQARDHGPRRPRPNSKRRFAIAPKCSSATR
jgi:predicted ArsR family transcriptional regulator